MFVLTVLRDVVRVAPEKFDRELLEVEFIMFFFFFAGSRTLTSPTFKGSHGGA